MSTPVVAAAAASRSVATTPARGRGSRRQSGPQRIVTDEEASIWRKPIARQVVRQLRLATHPALPKPNRKRRAEPAPEAEIDPDPAADSEADSATSDDDDSSAVAPPPPKRTRTVTPRRRKAPPPCTDPELGRDRHGLLALTAEQMHPPAVVQAILAQMPPVKEHNYVMTADVKWTGRFLPKRLAVIPSALFPKRIKNKAKRLSAAARKPSVPVDLLAWSLSGANRRLEYGAPAQTQLRIPVFRKKDLPRSHLGTCPDDVLQSLFPQHPVARRSLSDAAHAVRDPLSECHDPYATVSVFAGDKINTVGAHSELRGLTAIRLTQRNLQRRVRGSHVVHPFDMRVDNVMGTIRLTAKPVDNPIIDVAKVARLDPMCTFNEKKIHNVRLPNMLTDQGHQVRGTMWKRGTFVLMGLADGQEYHQVQRFLAEFAIHFLMLDQLPPGMLPGPVPVSVPVAT